MKRARLVDVAREAGVSIGAASDALAGKNRIPEVTRERVREAAARLGYVPNAAARALGSGHLPIIGLVIGALRRPGEFEPFRTYWADVIGQASVFLAQRGYALAVLPGLGDQVVQAVPFAGLILLDTVPDDPDLERALATGVPVFSEAASQPERLAVVLDAWYDVTLRDVLDHLTAAGAERPAVLWPDTGTLATAQVFDGARAWSKGTGREVLLADSGVGGTGSAAAVDRLLAAGVDAIYCEGPDFRWVKEAAAARGLVIGRDLLVVVEDEDPLGVFADADVSTVAYSAADAVEPAMTAFLDVVEGRASAPLHVPFRHRLIARGSSAGTSG